MKFKLKRYVLLDGPKMAKSGVSWYAALQRLDQVVMRAWPYHCRGWTISCTSPLVTVCHISVGNPLHLRSFYRERERDSEREFTIHSQSFSFRVVR